MRRGSEPRKRQHHDYLRPQESVGGTNHPRAYGMCNGEDVYSQGGTMSDVDWVTLIVIAFIIFGK